MRQARGPPEPSGMPPQQPFAAPAPPPPSANLAAIMAQQQQQQQQQQQHAEQQRPRPDQMPMLPGGIPPAAAAMQMAARTQAEAQAAHFARMKALLDAMPPPVQQAILSLPPPMQFDSLDSVVQAIPQLRTGSPDEGVARAAVSHIHETASRKIQEMQRQEAKMQRRQAKIQAMSRYNGLMSRYDQDFVTRIQVSQLVTADPYADDFYAHIFFALRGGRGPSAPVLGQGAAEKPKNGARNGKKQPKLSRRENAMLRMQQGVERIVKHRLERSEKTTNGIALEGALGKISASSTKGMRQMLSLPTEGATNAKSVSASGAQDALRAALAGASLGQERASGQKRPALGRHEVLRILEKLYDTVLALEQLRRTTADQMDEEAQLEQTQLGETLWTELRVLEPLDISDPHPFVSLLSTSKGKRLLPRVLRHLSPEQTLTTMTMIVASFQALDIVKHAHLLDGETPGALTEQREEIAKETELFGNTIVPSMMTLIAGAPMKIVSGMLAVFIERNDAVRVARSRVSGCMPPTCEGGVLKTLCPSAAGSLVLDHIPVARRVSKAGKHTLFRGSGPMVADLLPTLPTPVGARRPAIPLPVHSSQGEAPLRPRLLPFWCIRRCHTCRRDESEQQELPQHRH